MAKFTPAGDGSAMGSDYIDRDRVRRQTRATALSAIDACTRDRIRRYGSATDEALDYRIAELEGEWDMERVLETNASILALTGTVLGLAVNRRFFFIPAVVLGFLTQHALTGWCPPVPVFRHLGIRTQAEIDRERCALKALRGDFDRAPDEIENAFAAAV